MGKTVKTAGAAAGLIGRRLGKKLNYNKITKGVGTAIKKTVVPVRKTVRKVSKRLMYLGRTPGKASRTGREVIARMKRNGQIVNRNGIDNLVWTNPKTKKVEFVPLDKCDMGHHPVDAVSYWNSTGYRYGPKAPEVRAWMLDEKNYMLQPSSFNRSEGAKLGINYRDP